MGVVLAEPISHATHVPHPVCGHAQRPSTSRPRLRFQYARRRSDRKAVRRAPDAPAFRLRAAVFGAGRGRAGMSDGRRADAAGRSADDAARHRRRAPGPLGIARLALGADLRLLARRRVRLPVRRNDPHGAARPARDARSAPRHLRRTCSGCRRVLRPQSGRPARDARDVRRRIAERAVHRGRRRGAGRSVHAARDQRA